ASGHSPDRVVADWARAGVSIGRQRPVITSQVRQEVTRLRFSGRKDVIRLSNLAPAPPLIHGFDGYQPAAMREASNRSPYEEPSKYWSAIKKSTPSATSTEASSAVEFRPSATPRPPEAFPKPLKLGFHLNNFSLGHFISSYH
ncbi:hypothetical protein PRIPAC_92915, partial [Pristionchus pacificus]|uniref:Uncharacterized protein n=1 Tax=Pristionchus pacificus TaxID=54126 RepID=A0A2A6CD27_PRIPA